MANQNHKGIIDVVNEKPWEDRKTGESIKLYSFKLEGSNRWFRTGTTPVPFGKNDAVQFVADGQTVDLATMEAAQGEVERAPAPSARASTGRPASRQTVSRDEYWANKEARDIAKEEEYQNVAIPRMTRSTAVQAAAAVVDTAIKNDALGFGSSAKSKRVGMLAGYVTEIADELVKYIMDGPQEEVATDGE